MLMKKDRLSHALVVVIFLATMSTAFVPAFAAANTGYATLTPFEHFTLSVYCLFNPSDSACHAPLVIPLPSNNVVATSAAVSSPPSPSLPSTTLQSTTTTKTTIVAPQTITKYLTIQAPPVIQSAITSGVSEQELTQKLAALQGEIRSSPQQAPVTFGGMFGGPSESDVTSLQNQINTVVAAQPVPKTIPSLLYKETGDDPGYYALAVQGNYAYAMINTSGNTIFNIYDISNPSAPVIKGSATGTNPGPESIYVSGKYAYVAGFTDVRIFDVSNPTSPTLVSDTGVCFFTTHVVVQGKYMYVGCTVGGGVLSTYDISNPASPTIVSSVSRSTPGFANVDLYHFALQGNYIYSGRATYYSSSPGLDVINISNPYSPQEVGSTTAITGASRDTVVSGNYAYVLDLSPSSEKIDIVDVSNPTNPTLINTISPSTPGFAGITINDYQSIAVSGNKLYVPNGGFGKLVVIDVTNPLSPILISSTVSGASSDYSADSYIAVAGNVAYIAAGGNASHNGSFASIDISNLADPANTTTNTTTPFNGQITGDLFLTGNITSLGALTANTGLFTNGLGVFSSTTAPALTVGGTSIFTGQVGIGTTTPYATLSVVGSNVATTTLALRPIASQTANILDIFNPSGALTSVIGANGNFGIGTTTPPSTLTVSGSACISKGSGATAPCSTTAGTITANVFNTASADLAEDYTTTDSSITAGTIVSVDPNNDSSVIKATSGSSVMGVVSTQPGVLLGGGNASTSVPVALAGRVPVKFSSENGALNRGDSLTISKTHAGVAMKADEGDPVIGTALENISSSGTVLVFVRPAFATVDSNITNATSTANIQLTSSDPITLLAEAISSTLNWIGQKVVAVEGIFHHIQTDTINVAQGIQMTSPDGTTYCVTVANGGGFNNTAGTCGSPTPAQAPTINIQLASSTDATTTDQSNQNIASTTPLISTTTPETPGDISVVSTSTPFTPTQSEHTQASSTPVAPPVTTAPASSTSPS
jgi:hypothetical protein